MATRGLWSCFDYRWGWGRGGRGGIRVVSGHHARENWCYGGCRSGLDWRGLWWGRGRRRGPVRNDEGPTVDPRCGVLWIAWFGITWGRQKNVRFVGKGPSIIITIIIRSY